MQLLPNLRVLSLLVHMAELDVQSDALWDGAAQGSENSTKIGLVAYWLRNTHPVWKIWTDGLFFPG